MKAVNYIKLHWKGELPLAMAYLVNYVLVTTIIGLALWQMVENLEWNSGLLQRGVIVYSLCFSIVIYVWGAVGALRSLLKISGNPILYIAYPVYAISMIRFVRFFWKIIEAYFG